MRCMRSILDIKWQDHIANGDILTYAGVPSMYSRLSQLRLRWLGRVRRIEDGRILKDVLYGQLASGSKRVGRPAFLFKDTCKRDMKACKIDIDTWEDATGDRARWGQKLKQGTIYRHDKKLKRAKTPEINRINRARSWASGSKRVGRPAFRFKVRSDLTWSLLIGFWLLFTTQSILSRMRKSFAVDTINMSSSTVVLEWHKNDTV